MDQNRKNKRNNRSRDRRNIKKDEFDSNLLDLTRVERMTGGGRRLRFRATVIVGDRKGKVGLGVAKGLDVAQAIEKATRLAKKNVVKVPIVEGTVPFEVEAKYGSARILIRPQRKGRGLVAGGTVRVICELSGIQDISSKVLSKSRNKINNAKATILAFQKLKKK
jgi:small subunit ribosomal protein S5